MAHYEALRRTSPAAMAHNGLELQPLTRRESGSWSRRGDFWAERRRLNFFSQPLHLSRNRVYVGAVAVAACIAVAYILLDVRVHVEVRRPCICPNATTLCAPSAPSDGEAGGFSRGGGAAPGRWLGYDSYLRSLGALATLPPVAEAQQLKVATRGPYGYAQFSAHRMGPGRIASVGFGARHLKDHVQVGNCTWRAAGGNATLTGRAEVLYTDEHWDHTYDTIVIHCVLDKPTLSSGGYAAVTIDKEELIFYREEEGRVHPLEPPPAKELPHYLAVCTPAAPAPLEPRSIAEFLEYYKKLGASRFVLYDGGALDRQLAGALQRQLALGIVEAVPFRGVQRYDLWRDGYYVSLHDCIYRSRFSSRWVAAANWDEFLWVRPPETLLSLLAAREGRPWLTHGETAWAISICRPGPPIFGYSRLREDLGSSQPFSIERMVFRWPAKAVCHTPESVPDVTLCLGGNGARKYILDPRQVVVARVNDVAAPAEGGENLNFDLAHHHKFTDLHLAANFTAVCNDTRHEDTPIEWWARDFEEEEFSISLRQAPYPVPLPRAA